MDRTGYPKNPLCLVGWLVGTQPANQGTRKNPLLVGWLAGWDSTNQPESLHLKMRLFSRILMDRNNFPLQVHEMSTPGAKYAT